MSFTGATAAQAQTATPAAAIACEGGNADGVCDSDQSSADAAGIVAKRLRQLMLWQFDHLSVQNVMADYSIIASRQNINQSLVTRFGCSACSDL